MDKQKLVLAVRNWEKKYRETISERISQMSNDDLRKEMRDLDNGYTEQQLAKFNREVMINFLRVVIKPDAAMILANALLDCIERNNSHQEIAKSISKLINLISGYGEDEKIKEINIELIDELSKRE